MWWAKSSLLWSEWRRWCLHQGLQGWYGNLCTMISRRQHWHCRLLLQTRLHERPRHWGLRGWYELQLLISFKRWFLLNFKENGNGGTKSRDVESGSVRPWLIYPWIPCAWSPDLTVKIFAFANPGLWKIRRKIVSGLKSGLDITWTEISRSREKKLENKFLLFKRHSN